jgi:tetratricopeptide (TPR) repeat protein
MRKNLLIAGLAVFGAVVPAAAQTAEEIAWCRGLNNASPDQQVKGCSAIIDSKKYAGKALGFAFMKRCWANLMLSYQRSDDADAALADCNEALRLFPNDRVALYDRACVYDKRRDYDRAIADFSRLVELNPKDFDSLNNRGNAHQQKGEFELAVKDFTASIENNPGTNKNSETTLTVPTSLSNRCFARASAGQLKEAMADCAESLRLEPGRALAQRAFVYLKMGKLDEAVADYDAALRAKPKNPYNLYGRGVAKRRKGDLAGAKADIDAAKALDGRIVETFKIYGVE